MKHAPIPWQLVQVPGLPECHMVVDANGTSVPYGMEGNPHLIKACVNGCEGIHDPEETVPQMLAVVKLIHSAAKANTGHGGVAHYSWREALADTQRVINMAEGKGNHEDQLQ